MMEGLRDDFAKTAMASLIRESFLTRRQSANPGGSPNDYGELAKHAYAIADAMTAARERAEPQAPTKTPLHSP